MKDRVQIYVALLGEGTEVWRPVEAEQIGPVAYRLAGPVPEGETWEFQPGDVVRCKEKLFFEGVSGLVAIARAG